MSKKQIGIAALLLVGAFQLYASFTANPIDDIIASQIHTFLVKASILAADEPKQDNLGVDTVAPLPVVVSA